jgi:RIO kinase 1
MEVVRMLAAGVIHGDLSEYNILLGADGPVIIDLPQAVDAAGNNHALAMLERDVGNLRHFFGRFAPDLLFTDYGHEIWAHYEAGTLTPDVQLTGRYERVEREVDLEGVVREIGDAILDEKARQLGRLEAQE